MFLGRFKMKEDYLIIQEGIPIGFFVQAEDAKLAFKTYVKWGWLETRNKEV